MQKPFSDLLSQFSTLIWEALTNLTFLWHLCPILIAHLFDISICNYDPVDADPNFAFCSLNSELLST